ncbi:unnamed protein product, partial [marine sediment metagenome]
RRYSNLTRELLSDGNEFIMYVDICELIDNNSCIFINRNGKEYVTSNLEVWSDKGFTPIKYVMRHKTKKKIYKIKTKYSEIKVTEDHSLLDKNGKEISPKNIKVGNYLLTKRNPYHTYYDDGKIISIEDLGYSNSYVYDLETENHHFAAGIGQLVVHNTDSSMPDIGIKDPSKAYEMAKIVAEELSKLFPAPMLVEDEEVYHTMLCIKKKLYLCIKMNKDGTPVLDRNKLKVKGALPARRDNCPFQKDSYIDVAWKVLLGDGLVETYDYLIDLCLKLMRREVSWKDLVMIKGLGSG